MNYPASWPTYTAIVLSLEVAYHESADKALFNEQVMKSKRRKKTCSRHLSNT